MHLSSIIFAITLLSSLSVYADCGQPHGESPAPSEPSTGPSVPPPEAPGGSVQDEIMLKGGEQGPSPFEDGPIVGEPKTKKSKAREEHEVDKDGKRTKTTRYDKNGNKVSETTYQDDGKTPRQETEFYKDGSPKKETYHDDQGRLTQENEYWPPREGQEQGNIKSATTEHYDADGNRTGTTRHTYNEEGNTIRSDVHDRNGGDTITRYDPKTGTAIDQVITHPNGKIQSDIRFDREGNVISQKTYRENGRPESEITNFPDGSSRHQEFSEDGGVTNTNTDADGNVVRQTVDRRGQVREQMESHGWRQSTTKRFREDGSMESQAQTRGLQTEVKTFDKKGNPESETTLEHGMATNSVRYAKDGSSTRNEFYRDGSVRSQTKTNADGSRAEQKYPNGQYFEAEDGSVFHNP